jgi:hypothetical protein
MAENLLRQGQLVGAFGPGSFVDLPERSVIISGLGDWQKRPEDKVSDPRLLAYLRRRLALGELQLYSPPEFNNAPDAPKLGVSGLIYPTWFVTQDRAATDPSGLGRRRLVRIQATEHHGLRFQDPEDGKRKSLTPIRFVCACRKGHTNDVDWRTYAHRGSTDCQRTLWLEERGTSGEVADTWVGCDCGNQRRLYEALDASTQPLGWCKGSRPWLGPYHNEESCGQPNRLLVRSASNAYFAEVISTISLPDVSDEFGKRLGDILDLIKNVTTEAQLEMLKELQPQVRTALIGTSNDQILEFLSSRTDEGPGVSVKEAEFDVLVSGITGRNEPDSNYFSETLVRSAWDPENTPYMKAIERVVLVHRLREVVAQVGFTRFEPISMDIDGELDGGVERQDLADPVEWLPAIEHRGEGVFFQLSAQAIAAWLEHEDVKAHVDELAAGYALWAADKKLARPFVGAPYILLHSLSHLLIAAIALECGYPATSLRERIYALADGKYGILIHTGSAGSEGTLGGVVAAGRRLADHMKRALVAGTFCSNDPVCADHQADGELEQRYLHGAACHGCLLIAEPSCEHRNDLLDRALVTATVRTQKAAFFPLIASA